MYRIKKILVPVDFSPCSRSALEHAIAIARAIAASVHVLHVWTPHVVGSGLAEIAEAALSARNKKLRSFVSEVASSSDAVLDQRVEIGDPLQRIVEDSDAYDLITIGTHGNSEGSRLIGSVADAVVRNASCPVLTVRTSSR